ncbi:MAG: rhodanese-like domain-containing protein [Candidatus Rokubacteria bacterium]|nr:rhodanese-like domain-containing protein [Candidatus Rokubacteria bacterium]
MVKRLGGIALVIGAALWVNAAPADDPEFPLGFISVDELKAHMDRRQPVDLIDVRTWGEYVKRRIKGARAMPLRAVPARAQEIKKTGLVVFY